MKTQDIRQNIKQSWREGRRNEGGGGGGQVVKKRGGAKAQRSAEKQAESWLVVGEVVTSQFVEQQHWTLNWSISFEQSFKQELFSKKEEKNQAR